MVKKEQGMVGMLRDLIALATALGAFVVLTGAFALALRMAAAHLPSEAVLGQMPRGQLVTIGLAQVIGPTAIVVALHVWRRASRGPPRMRGRWADRLRFLAAGLMVVLFGVTAAAALTHGGAPAREEAELVAGIGMYVGFAFVFAIGELRLRTDKGTRGLHGEPVTDDDGLPPWVPLTVAYGLVTFLVLLALAGTAPLKAAVVCTPEKGYVGELVTGTGSRIVLGQPDGTEGRSAARLLVFRDSEVKALMVDEEANEDDCAPYTERQ
jgi:hypothetical protein